MFDGVVIGCVLGLRQYKRFELACLSIRCNQTDLQGKIGDEMFFVVKVIHICRSCLHTSFSRNMQFKLHSSSQSVWCPLKRMRG